MDCFAVLADRYAKSTLPDLAHSALPGAPQQPYVAPRRRMQAIIAGLRRAAAPAARRRTATAPYPMPPVRSPGAIPGG